MAKQGSEMNDLQLHLESQQARNIELEKKQKKFVCCCVHICNQIYENKTSWCTFTYQIYVLAKFQLRILKILKLYPYKVSVIKRSICTVSIGKINYRHLLKQILVTYEWSAVQVQTQNFHHHVCHALRNGLLGKSPLSAQTELKS